MLKAGLVVAPLVLFVGLGARQVPAEHVAHEEDVGRTAQAAPESQPSQPFEPSEADLACEADTDCVVTCQLTTTSCCPIYCTACTTVLNREAHQRRLEECRESPEECPTVGACAQEPTERSIPRCVDERCTFELIPVEATPPEVP